ncbi:MAG: hypothetical protein IJV34_07525 [Prevotella sp.]|nr:hypothetical protein [Prevotella sp.]
MYYDANPLLYPSLKRGESYREEYADVTNTEKPYDETRERPSVKFWIEYPPTDFEIEEGVAYTRITNAKNINVTYKRSFDSERVDKFQAWFMPFDYTVTAADLEKFTFYKINMIANAEHPGENPESDEVYIFVNPVEAGTVLKGNKPYVYKPKEAVTDYVFSIENTTLLAKTDASVLHTETAQTNYDYYGTYDNTTATAGSPFYYISVNGNICYGTSVTVGPYRWILRATDKDGVSYARPITFIEDEGETTGIKTVESSKQLKAHSYYDLQGRRVEKPAKGLYISGGKKVFIK